MNTFQDDCLTIEKYAKRIGKSRRTVQRYIVLGMPTIKGITQCIHLPTVNQWWLSRITSTCDNGATND